MSIKIRQRKSGRAQSPGASEREALLLSSLRGIGRVILWMLMGDNEAPILWPPDAKN